MHANKCVDLCVVMPVFNEGASIVNTIREWATALRQANISFSVLVINDGSTDNTKAELETIGKDTPELQLIHRQNVGHGASCVFGYQLAVQQAQWVFQVDSDGQCDPAFFAEFWHLRNRWPVVFGYRRQRDDGLLRILVSRGVSLVVWLATFHWIWDANVPYRLMRADALKAALENLPQTTVLSNVLLAYVLQRGNGLRWVPIRFRRRAGGVSSLRWKTLPLLGQQVFRALRTARAKMNHQLQRAATSTKADLLKAAH